MKGNSNQNKVRATFVNIVCVNSLKQKIAKQVISSGTFLCLIGHLTLLALSSYGQGEIIFANLASGVDAPVTNAAGIRIVGPAPYLADLFWSSDTNAPTDSLTPAGFNQPFSTSTLYGGGHFVAGCRLMPTADWIRAQVRVWDATYGPTYEQARDNGGEFGSSNLILVRPDLPPGPCAPLTGLQGFQLGTIPEPSATTLAIIGAAALFLRLPRKLLRI
jgi:hypothetical protein